MEHGGDFAATVTAEMPSLLRAAYLLTGDANQAEDLVQATLTAAYLSWHRVSAADAPAAYLRRILINAHRRSFRRRRLRELLTDIVPDRGGVVTDSDLRRDLVAAVGSLPPRQRAVVVLRYLEDRSEAEVAAILGCKVGTVKSQASRALRALREHPALAGSTPLVVEEVRP